VIDGTSGTVSGCCLGLLNNGDPATLSATYTVRPKQAISP
jgi:hypothetical protein